jgi:hypothetical protein
MKELYGFVSDVQVSQPAEQVSIWVLARTDVWVDWEESPWDAKQLGTAKWCFISMRYYYYIHTEWG